MPKPPSQPAPRPSSQSRTSPAQRSTAHPARHPADLLEAALATDPGRPFVTYYDDATGERVELSVGTFANWVAKTANLLVDGLAAEPGRRVALAVPAHWQSAVWLFACWSAGSVVVPVGEPAGTADADAVVEAARAAEPELLVASESALAPAMDLFPDVEETVGLSLHPLGAPLADPPAGVLDYATEIRAYGDRFVPSGLSPEAPALWPVPPRGTTDQGTADEGTADTGTADRDAADEGAADTGAARRGTAGAGGPSTEARGAGAGRPAAPLSGAELVAAATDAARAWGLGERPRVLSAVEFVALPDLLAGLLAPIAAGGSVIICRNLAGHLDSAGLDRRLTMERVTAVAGVSPRDSVSGSRPDVISLPSETCGPMPAE